MFDILIVEDEITAAEGIRNEISGRLGKVRNIFVARNGQAGLQMAKEHHPDIILTDVRMPIMDGLSMIRQLREWGFTTRVIVISGYSEFEYHCIRMYFDARVRHDSRT